LFDGRRVTDRDIEGFASLPTPDDLGVDVELQIDRGVTRTRERIAQRAHASARAIAAEHF
jgi:hypothetical protein